MLLPALNKARENARTTQCVSNVRQLGTGVTMYANDNREQLPKTGKNSDGGATPWSLYASETIGLGRVSSLCRRAADLRRNGLASAAADLSLSFRQRRSRSVDAQQQMPHRLPVSQRQPDGQCLHQLELHGLGRPLNKLSREMLIICSAGNHAVVARCVYLPLQSGGAALPRQRLRAENPRSGVPERHRQRRHGQNRRTLRKGVSMQKFFCLFILLLAGALSAAGRLRGSMNSAPWNWTALPGSSLSSTKAGLRSPTTAAGAVPFFTAGRAELIPPPSGSRSRIFRPENSNWR